MRSGLTRRHRRDAACALGRSADHGARFVARCDLDSDLDTCRRVSIKLWRKAQPSCSREDSNLHGLPHTVLSRTRLPIPPRELKKFGPLNCAAISRAQAEMTRYGLALNLSAPSFTRPGFQLLRLAGFAQRTEQVGIICSHDFVILWRLIGRFFPTLERCAVKLGCFWIIAAGMIDDRQIAFRLGNVGMC